MDTKKYIDYFHKSYTKSDNGCWIWERAKNPKGYANCRFNGVSLGHRISYSLFVGTIPDGMCVLHTCDNPSCVNPDHLWIGTNADNVADKVSKGRSHTASWLADQVGEKNLSAKLSESDVIEIRKRIAGSERQDRLAAEFRVSKACITKIHFRRTWKHI